MNSKEVASFVGCTPQNIRKKTKQANDKGLGYIEIKGARFVFSLVQNSSGKAYEYIEENSSPMAINSSDSSVILGDTDECNLLDSSSIDTYRSKNTHGYDRFVDNLHNNNIGGMGTKEVLKKDKNANTSGQATTTNRVQTRVQERLDEVTQISTKTCHGSDGASTDGATRTVERGDNSSQYCGAKSQSSHGSLELKKEVVAYAKMHSPTASSKFFNVPLNTVYRWIKGFEESGSKALQDKRGGVVRADIERIKEAIWAGGSMSMTSWWDIYCRLYSERNALVYDMLDPKADISRATFLRHATKLKKQDKSVREFLGKGLDGLSVRPTAIRDYLGVNEEWQIDATKVDFMALNEDGEPTRYTAIAIVDVGSKRRVWLLADSPNSYANVRLLKKALLKLGRPEFIKGDNGKDYVGEHFQGVLDRLGISYIKAQPFRGDQKGKVERGFGVEQGFLQKLPGFIGHNVAQRNQRENQEVHKSERLSGVKTNLKNLLTKGELEAYIDEYLERRYFSEDVVVKKVEFDFRVLGKSYIRQLHATGFHLNNTKYLSLDVFRSGAQIGDRLEMIEDIDDLSTYHVYKAGEYLCDVYNNEVASYTAEEWKAVQKEYRSMHVKAKKSLIKLAQNTKDELFKADAKRLEQKRKKVQIQEKKELAKKEKTKDSIAVKEITIGNKKRYLPDLNTMEEYLG